MLKNSGIKINYPVCPIRNARKNLKYVGECFTKTLTEDEATYITD